MSVRANKLAEQIQRHAAAYVQRESNRTSLITVTDVALTPDLKVATIYITVLPDEAQQKALAFLNRHKKDAQWYIRKRLRAEIPEITFALAKQSDMETEVE